METSNRYIIVANSGRGRNKAFRILDLERMEFVGEVCNYKPFNECLALNKKQNGVTVIEHAAEHSLHTDAGKSADLEAVSNASAESTSQAVA